MRKVDGLVQIVLGLGLIAAIVYGCKPAADTLDVSGHNPATCQICQAPRELGEGDTDHGLMAVAQQHLDVCARCRGRGYTLVHAIAAGEPTPCLVDYDATKQATHSSSSTR
jgi:hypothetical protein